ncbi:esterase/beta-lactamase LipL [Mycolicibacterium brisbanense]|uniref:Penicillin-binding protein, beta-lactamase class C n=1 Tax=Mycolicibacterium brisbanense TaxID=146020 RepID=A0A117I7W4_9MYCO|nr:serine hydrolase domain-containing protein [Mycolicibacterium brisbanense]MCV7162403.1 beta-lactamase family protein [Mycolicibacterium brisbanense]GAS92190.1 penicillin-binding protein, beta-lactamase class C [Mycolicibacterium brisbanense]
MSDSDCRGRNAALPHGVQGAADANFGCTVRAFSQLFPGRRFGGGALAVFQDGEPVVDVWTGFSDRAGTEFWTADTGAMVFSATKGMASTVIHRLVDRGLLDYDTPVCAYWPEFGENGKAGITVRQVMAHRAGLSQLNGVSLTELLNPRLMEERIAASPVSAVLFDKPAYHALTYGWLLSGLARSVTGQGMRDLMRAELAEPLGTDGLHLGRPPAGAPTRAAQILAPQRLWPNHLFDFLAPKLAGLDRSGAFGSMYVPGVMSLIRGETPFLDSEIPAANGVATARGLARMYGAIANAGRFEGVEFLSPQTVARLTGPSALRPDRNLVLPLPFHLGYHSVPFGVMPGFGHVGMGGSVGWADPASGLAIGFVHNRLVTPMVLDMTAFVALNAIIRKDVGAARRRGYQPVPDFGSGPFELTKPAAG